MSKLWFVQEVPSIEKAARRKAKLKPSGIALVGLLTAMFIALAIILYAIKQPDAGRLVIDIAIAFLAWCTGQTVGERAGVEGSGD